jgi:hypothetical protein
MTKCTAITPGAQAYPRVGYGWPRFPTAGAHAVVDDLTHANAKKPQHPAYTSLDPMCFQVYAGWVLCYMTQTLRIIAGRNTATLMVMLNS